MSVSERYMDRPVHIRACAGARPSSRSPKLRALRERGTESQRSLAPFVRRVYRLPFLEVPCRDTDSYGLCPGHPRPRLAAVIVFSERPSPDGGGASTESPDRRLDRRTPTNAPGRTVDRA